MSEQNKSRVKREFTQHMVVFTLKNGKEIEKVIKKRDLESILAVKPKNTVSAQAYSHYVIEFEGLKDRISLDYQEDDMIVFGEVVGFEQIALHVKPTDLIDFIMDWTLANGVNNNAYTKRKFVKANDDYFILTETFTQL